MKRKILLLSAVTFCIGTAEAQIKAYAITGSQKGSSNWTEVRQVDASSGEEVKTIYKNSQEIEKLNARTGKAIAVKDATTNVNTQARAAVVNNQDNNVTIIRQDGNNKTVIVTRAVPAKMATFQSDAPFATTSAALAYDKKHDRLYYTPMGINELRYLDMKSKTTKVFYFEGESFGALKGRHDVPNQITRMVIASDGKGYALTNNADHLIQFETDKKPEVKDLGSLIDDPSNGKYTVHSSSNYGGDIVADAQGGLWLIGANRRIYKIDMKTMVATFKGSIQGLPGGFSTNGACVEENGGDNIIVCSSTSTQGYFRVNMNTLQAEKASSASTVFNASDLANEYVLFSKKKKKDEPKENPVLDVKEEPVEETPENIGANTTNTNTKPQFPATEMQRGAQTIQTEGLISVYPNPVTNFFTRIAFKNHPNGKYQVQVMDVTGKIISTTPVTISSRLQVETLNLPQALAKGSYMIKVVNFENKVVGVNPIILQ